VRGRGRRGEGLSVDLEGVCLFVSKKMHCCIC
jgi:hypothetical protein